MLLLLCLSLALAGCKALLGDPPQPHSSGDSVPGGAGGAGGDDPVVVGGGGGGRGGMMPPDPALGAALREEPDPTVVDARAQSIDHFDIGPDGRTVVVYWWGGNTACFGLKQVKVEVSDGTPSFTVLEGTRGDNVGQACTMEAVLKSAVVTLDDPIVADAAGADAAPGEPELPADALQAKPVAGVIDPRLHAVTGYRLSADGLTLTAYYVSGIEDCSGLADASAERHGEGLLTVAIREGQLAEPMGACRDIGVAKFVKFSLTEPLIAVAALDSGSEVSEPAY
jgi:hypothetical protein